jgi:hypothetical protein
MRSIEAARACMQENRSTCFCWESPRVTLEEALQEALKELGKAAVTTIMALS